MLIRDLLFCLDAISASLALRESLLSFSIHPIVHQISITLLFVVTLTLTLLIAVPLITFFLSNFICASLISVFINNLPFAYFVHLRLVLLRRYIIGFFNSKGKYVTIFDSFNHQSNIYSFTFCSYINPFTLSMTVFP